MQTQPMGRMNRFTALAETSFKSPTEMRYSIGATSKSPNDDGSRKRRLSHSPVSVNTTYEISEHNTDKLWENFQSNIKRGGGSNSQQRLRSNDNRPVINASSNSVIQNYKSINNIEKQEYGQSYLQKSQISQMQEFKSTKDQTNDLNFNKYRQTTVNVINNNPSFGDQDFLKNSMAFQEIQYRTQLNYNSNNTFEKSEDKNRLLLGSKLKELFKISKDDSTDLMPNYNHLQKAVYDEKNDLAFNQYKTIDQRQSITDNLGNLDYQSLRYQNLNNQNLLLSPGSLNTPHTYHSNSNIASKQANSPVATQNILQNNQREVIQSNGKSNSNYKNSNFKSRVQQRISEIKNELEEPRSNSKSRALDQESLIRTGDYKNLDEYLSQQNNTQFQTGQQVIRNNTQGFINQNLISSLGPQSEQFNKTTSRFNNYGGTQSSVAESNAQNIYSPNKIINKPESFDIFNDLNSNTQTNASTNTRQTLQNQPTRYKHLESIKQFENQLKLNLNQSSSHQMNQNQHQYQHLRMRSQEKSRSGERLSVHFQESDDKFQYFTRQDFDQVLEEGQESSNKYRSHSANKYAGLKKNFNKNSSSKSSIFQTSTLKQGNRQKITDEPYFHKNWTQQKGQLDQMNLQSASKNTESKLNTDAKYGLQDSIYVQSINDSILQSKKNLGSSNQTSDCRRMVFNMVNNVRQQQRSRQSSKLGQSVEGGASYQSLKENLQIRGSSKSKTKSPYLATTGNLAYTGVDLGGTNNTYDQVLQERFLQNYKPEETSTKIFSNKFNNVKDRIQHIQKQCCLKIQLIEKNKTLADDKFFTSVLANLLSVEKLLRQIYSAQDQTFNFLRIFNSYLLVYFYHIFGENGRIIKYLEQDTKSNINLKTMLENLQKKHRLKKEVGNYVLNIMKIYSKILVVEGRFSKAVLVLSDISRLYERWRSNQYSINLEDESYHVKNEFGIDDFIEVRSCEAECLMQLGKIFDAVEKFEWVKSEIDKEIVFDKPLIYINICNQLGNCYLKTNNSSKALENFEASMLLISKLEDKSQVNELIISKICQNIALISDQKGYVNDCIKMSEKSLTLKLNVLPQYHNEVLNSQVQCALSYEHAGDYERACQYFEKAYETSKNLNGENDIETAQILVQLSQAFEADDKYSECIKKLEHAALIMKRLEKNKIPTMMISAELTQSINKIILRLLNLYLKVNQITQAQSVIHEIDQRAKEHDDSISFKLLNELGNTLRNHNNSQFALEFYKKALQFQYLLIVNANRLCLKNKYKNSYLEQYDSSKILINIASCEYIRENYHESLKYYEYALQVLQNHKSIIKDTKDSAKVLMQIGRIHQELGNYQLAHQNFNKATSKRQKGWRGFADDIGSSILDQKDD
ncbi:tpr domain containing protein [Stylonychia lemnae]|uniref:Tpr domain containing protein n=1 Tax=Stylonychia lemnae TaxID=5949 RepID=A0A078ANU2_STYLE|nr:tpr domain containing protein [Stylonychia lemnae]|eukprot:CDW82633.1 tpr domain containing protein [Stylonychia lemnae]